MNLNCDVLIVGTGVSGLYSALNLNSELDVIVVSKTSLTETNTFLAQGGISTVLNIDDIPLFIEDTMKAGKYKNDYEAVKVLAEESRYDIDHIMEFGMPLDIVNGKDLSYTKEGAHSVNRIVHAKDRTGRELAQLLITRVKERPNVTIIENAFLVDLLVENNSCNGGIFLNDDGQLNIFAKETILATGGIGGLFRNSTNQRTITADAIAIALKNGIKLKNLEYVQFHPTAFYSKDDKYIRFLISESLRGEGAKLLNSKGIRFTDELQPRDVVSAAINEEIRVSGIPYVFLDISFLSKDYIINRFPTVYEQCMKAGVDITKEPIPVSPAQHYSMGGIEVNLNSHTSMDNLYAVGEASCTGVHGANRLASNSLLEGLVFSRRAASEINSEVNAIKEPDQKAPIITSTKSEIENNNMKILLEEFKRRLGPLNVELVDC